MATESRRCKNRLPTELLVELYRIANFDDLRNILALQRSTRNRLKVERCEIANADAMKAGQQPFEPDFSASKPQLVVVFTILTHQFKSDLSYIRDDDHEPLRSAEYEP